MTDPQSSRSVLVLCGFRGNPRKITTHVEPLSLAATTTVVCLERGPASDTIRYRTVPSPGSTLVGLILMQFVAIAEALRGDYDLIATFSLLPYGLFGLIAGTASRTPVHLGIIGGDVDFHAKQWYGPAVKWGFRRFDIVTVAAAVFERRLLEFGVDPDRIHTVFHPVDDAYRDCEPVSDPTYDVLWLARLSAEKEPLRFLDVLVELRDRSVDISAAMVGGGPMESTVRAAVKRRNLDDVVDLPGWTDEPIHYYRNARLCVLTSSREMLPLTVVEAMVVGIPVIVPPVGGIPDIVENGENGVLVPDRTPEAYADAIERLLDDDRLRRRISSNASRLGDDVSYEAVSESWVAILESVEGHRNRGESSNRRSTTGGRRE